MRGRGTKYQERHLEGPGSARAFKDIGVSERRDAGSMRGAWATAMGGRLSRSLSTASAG